MPSRGFQAPGFASSFSKSGFRPHQQQRRQGSSPSPPRRRNPHLDGIFDLTPSIKLSIVGGSIIDFGSDADLYPIWTKPSTSAIVNAANAGCLMGGGVDGAISDAGGLMLFRDRKALPILNADDNERKNKKDDADADDREHFDNKETENIPSKKKKKIASSSTENEGSSKNNDKEESTTGKQTDTTATKKSKGSFIKRLQEELKPKKKQVEKDSGSNDEKESKDSDDNDESEDEWNPFFKKKIKKSSLNEGLVRCWPGDAKLTSSHNGTNYGKLHVPHVIHAVGPNYLLFYDEEQDKADALLINAYRAALDQAHKADLTEVAFSLLSAGIYRGSQPLSRVLDIGLYAIQEWCCLHNPRQAQKDGSKGRPTTVRVIHLYAFTRREVSTLLTAAHDRFCTKMRG